MTLVVVNKGTKKHALAIMGETMSPKRTPTIAAGKTARLTVTLAAGKYHMWDPVTSSMSHAKFLTVKAPAKSSSQQRPERVDGRRVDRRLRLGLRVDRRPSGGGTGGGTMDPGMDGCDHM